MISVTKATVRNPDQLAARKRFKRFKPEEHNEVRSVGVKMTPGLKFLLSAWEKDKAENTRRDLAYEDGSRDGENLAELIKNLLTSGRYTEDDVSAFCLKIPELNIELEHEFSELEGVRLAVFLTELMEHGPGEKYYLPLMHVDILLCGLGFRSSKAIKIHGGEHEQIGGLLPDSGLILIEGANVSDIGGHCNGGGIYVIGDATDPVGSFMIEGVIEIEGNVEWNGIIERSIKDETGGIGTMMENGVIVINGDANTYVGHKMEGGEIHVNGDIEEIGDVIHGRIYQRGKLIVDK